MSRKKKPLPLIENVTIEACAAEGKSLFHWNDLVVFVPFCVPGDVVDVQLTRKKHSFAEGEVQRFIQYSNVRAIPRCQHFGICGGCKWQNLPYEAQLQMKQQQVYDQLTRIGHLELPEPGCRGYGGTKVRGCENSQVEDSRYEVRGTGCENSQVEELRYEVRGTGCENSQVEGEEGNRVPRTSHLVPRKHTIEFREILGSVQQYEYRNKLDFGASNRRWLTKEEIETSPNPSKGGESDPIGEEPRKSLKDIPALGFHITGAFDKILPIEQCHLMEPLHNEIRNAIRDYALQNGITFFDLRQQTGLLRDVIIRNSNTGEWMVIIQFHFDDDDSQRQAQALLQYVADSFPQISALLYLDNQKCNDTIGDQDIIVYKGNDHIFELMEDLRFKVGPKSFYQTNTLQAYHLYSVVRELMTAPPSVPEGATNVAGQKSNEAPSGAEGGALPLVYDLYTGTGTIANFVARQARQVIGIEYVPEAIEDAKVNSQINGIDNTLFFAGDMKDILNDDFLQEHGRPDIIITDPPRAGMHPDVVQTILRARPERIVYVSCNPATQARDLQVLCQDYDLRIVQPVDMFPHTPHVENVVLLVRKDPN